MKALSVRQPWAELLVRGKKTLELRTWTVAYRGPLAIHAAQTVEEQACLAQGLDPRRLTVGAVVGTVELANIVELDADSYAARADEHLAGEPFQAPLYGWELANPQALELPFAFRGRMGLFNVPDELLESAEREEALARPVATAGPLMAPLIAWSGHYAFELRVVPELGRGGEGRPGDRPPYRLALYQQALEPAPPQGALPSLASPPMRPLAELRGDSLRAVADQVLDALRQNGYQATDLLPGRRAPFALKEETGVRLGLLFLAVRPIAKMARVEAISAGLRAMTSEELYYWFSKCTAGPTADRALRALRMLLADE